MKKIIFGLTVFMLCGSVAWAVPDYKGYRKFLKQNDKKIRALEKECNKARGTKNALPKCNDEMQFKLEAECTYGVNPNACKAIEEIYKMNPERNPNKKEEKKQ